MNYGSGTLLFALFIFFIECVNGTSDENLLVNTNVGQIRGLRATDGNYTMFLGIPYGTVDEANPFGASTPFPNFEGIFDAYDDSAICPQIEEFNLTLAGSLDCLHLNVYVPDTNSSEPLAVLVWVYGGRFQIGFAGRNFYGPSFLMKQDIILVTLNYRVGPYGFMCLDIPEVPGNQGLKDQELAFKWIKNNIDAFGGDADKITLSGNSAGAMSVGLHMLSEGEKLYNKAILQSGNSLSPVFYQPLKDAPITIASHLDFKTNDLHEAITYLASVQPYDIITALHELNIESQFRPCIEKEFDGVESFLTVDWFKADKMSKVEDMSFLMGFTDNEKLFIYLNQESEFYKNSNIVEDVLSGAIDVAHEDFLGMTEIMHNFYFGDEELDENMKWEVIDFDTDFSYVYQAHREMKRYLNNGAEKVFLYMFSYVGEINFVRRRYNTTVGGASHADEISYLFDMQIFPEINAEDQKIIDKMTTLWANFVKYSDPTPETSELLPVKWEAITNNSVYHYINIDSDLSVGTRLHNDRMAFWDLFYEANQHLLRVYPDTVEETDSAANYRSLCYLLAFSPIVILLINY